MPAEGVVLTEGVMVHMLADIDQIITEYELDSGQRTPDEWMAMLRHAVEGSDYARLADPPRRHLT
jgi:hypothetical protein